LSIFDEVLPLCSLLSGESMLQRGPSKWEYLSPDVSDEVLRDFWIGIKLRALGDLPVEIRFVSCRYVEVVVVVVAFVVVVVVVVVAVLVAVLVFVAALRVSVVVVAADFVIVVAI